MASITFDPEQLSARVAYHGLQDWLRYQVREKKIKRARSWREVYEADPWTDKKAWSKAEIQVVVTK